MPITWGNIYNQDPTDPANVAILDGGGGGGVTNSSGLTPAQTLEYENYVKSYPDLVDYYNKNIAPTGVSMAQWGLEHWSTKGQNEGRTLPQAGSQVNSPTVTQTPTTPAVPTTPSGAIPTVPAPPAGSNTFTQAPVPSNVGGNYTQVQNSLQSGQFGTVDQSSQAQATQSGSTQNQSQTGTQATSGTSTSTTTPQDTLGFGALIQGQAADAAASDKQRNDWLANVMQTGGDAFNSQVNQAVRNSQTGPGMTGAGDSARARAAGYAASDVARNNLSQRLNAAGQLTQPGSLAGWASLATPYNGTTTTGSNDNLSTTINNLASNSTGWQNMINNAVESQSGVTNAQSSQAGAGNIPEGQPVKTGGCVLCTAAIQLDLYKGHRVLRKVIAHKLNKDWKRFRKAARGYFFIFTPVARWLLGHPKLAKLLWPLAKKVVYEELRVSGKKLPFRWDTWLTHWIGHSFCAAVGCLPVPGYVTDPVINAIARQENINFNVED